MILPDTRPHAPHPWRDPAFPQAGQRFRLGRLLAREPRYAALWRQTHDWAMLDRAGFIDDGLTHVQARALGCEDDFRTAIATWQTPLPDPQSCATREEAVPVVLLTTGSFAPFHAGHDAMLAAAEAAALAQGWSVLGTYVSPSHDLYVAGKDEGRCAAYPAALRMDEARSFLRATPSAHGITRFVDPWEALVSPRPLNFTTVARRLQRYLSAHLGRAVRVVYVFGADNAPFARCFAPHEAICVARPGFVPATQVVLAELEHPASSTQVRRQNTPSAPTPASPVGIYALRDEGSWAWSHWTDKVPVAALQSAWDALADRTQELLAQAFEDTTAARPRAWRRLSVADQRAAAVSLTKTHPVVSLDHCLSDLPQVHLWPRSRRFRIADHQVSPHGHGLSPGHQEPVGLPRAAWLVDDDSATGGTLASAERELAARGMRVVGTHLLLPPVVEGEALFDVVDLRDFLPGTRDGGLVVETPTGACVRVPYLAPFVDLSTRAKLPAGTAWSTSAALWRSAAAFFADLPVILRIEDMWPASRQAMSLQQWPADQSLQSMCEAMAAQCAPLPPPAPQITAPERVYARRP